MYKVRASKKAMVDDEDYELLMKSNWHEKDNGYASRGLRVNGKLKYLLMHRIIMMPPDGMVVDHLDNNKLNNQKSNLRVCTQQENTCRKRRAWDDKNPFLGVWRTKYGRFAVHISNKRVRLYLGTFVDPEEAARIYDKKSIELRKEAAATNFKDC